MSKLQLDNVEIHTEDKVYRVIVSASVEDTEFEKHVSFVSLDFSIAMDTENLNELEKKAVAKAEHLLKTILGLRLV